MTPCLEWIGGRTRGGYGRVYDGPAGHRRQVRFHRLVWEEAYGPLGPRECALHHCDNPPCYRLSHLFKGTRVDNILDMEQKGRGRHPRGEKNGMAVLSEDDVRQIRILLKEITGYGSKRRIARTFHTTAAVVRQVASGKVWRHVA